MATAVLAASLLVLGTGAANALWQNTDPCRDLSSRDGLPLAETAGDYVGLRVADAVSLGKQRGVFVRVACRERKSLLGTADLRDDRINIGVSDGVVTSAGAY